jgi:hypothetical protein
MCALVRVASDKLASYIEVRLDGMQMLFSLCRTLGLRYIPTMAPNTLVRRMSVGSSVTGDRGVERAAAACSLAIFYSLLSVYR